MPIPEFLTFAGQFRDPPQMDTISKDANLSILQDRLEAIGEGYLGKCSVDYIKACKSLYNCCVRKSLHPDYKAIIQNYTYHFKILHGLGYVSETTKAHMINSHFEDLMTESGMSLFLYDTNGLEAVHAALTKSDIRHGCVVTHTQVLLLIGLLSLSQPNKHCEVLVSCSDLKI